jgi:NHS family xanthosine MFS transporter
LSNSIAYNALKSNNYDVVKVFPPIRGWGTIGFIIAMWFTNLTGSKATENQFYIPAAAAFILGIIFGLLISCSYFICYIF